MSDEPATTKKTNEPCRYRPHLPHGTCPGWTRRQHAGLLLGDLAKVEREAPPMTARTEGSDR